MKRDCPSCGRFLGRKDLPVSQNGYGYLVAFCPYCGVQLAARRYFGDMALAVALILSLLGAGSLYFASGSIWLLAAVVMTSVLACVIGGLVLSSTRQRYVLWDSTDV